MSPSESGHLRKITSAVGTNSEGGKVESADGEADGGVFFEDGKVAVGSL